MFFLLFFMLNKEYFKHGLLTTLLTQTEMKNYLPGVILHLRRVKFPTF